MDIKENLAVNLVACRKNAKLTQAELAEKINYSDKAVSKWERGEAVPDLLVLKQLADFFGTTIDALISPPREKHKNLLLQLPKKRTIISASATVLVWLIAVACYVFLGMIFPSVTESWLAFIYAVPVTFVVLISLTAVWGKSIPNLVFSSLLVWTIILSIFLTINIFAPSQNLWMMFLIGIPVQILLILGFTYKKKFKK